jgi:hypothetical protein
MPNGVIGGEAFGGFKMKVSFSGNGRRQGRNYFQSLFAEVQAIVVSCEDI